MGSTVADTMLALSKHTFTTDIVTAVLPVKKVEQKKTMRPSLFFVLTKSRSRTGDVTLHLVKKGDKADSYKRKKTWALTDIRHVDGCSAGDLDLELTFADGAKKRWTCFSHRDKQEYAERMQSTVRQVRGCAIKFANFPSNLGGAAKSAGVGGSVGSSGVASSGVQQRRRELQRERGDSFAAKADDGTGKSSDAGGAFDMLSDAESRDLQAFLDSNKESVHNAENFVRRLNEQLRSLELSNIHALISSGAQVTQLTDHVQSARGVVEQLEHRVQGYTGRLQSVAPAIECLADRDKLAKLSAANQLRAAEALERLLAAIRFDESDRRLLREPNFKDRACVPALLKAARQCDSVLAADVPPELRKMAAVKDSTEGLIELKRSFASALVRHLNDIFINYANRRTTARSKSLAFSGHDENKRELLQFSQLMAWLKLNNREMFDELKGRYSRSLSKVYDAEFREVIETVKAILQPLSKDKGKPGALRHAGSNSSLNREGSKRSIGGGGGGGGGADSNPADSSSSSTLSSIAATLGSSVATLDNVFEKVLDALEPMVDSEETFCQAFFDLQPSVQQQTSTLTSSVMSTVSDDGTILSVDSGDSRQSLTRQEGKQELDELLKQIFSSAVGFLDALASACHSVSAEFSMQMLIRSADRSDRQSGRGRHLGYLYAQLCLRAKQRFDQFIDQMSAEFLEFRANKKSRCGVVAPVLTYEKFASRAGPVFRDSKRLPDLERAHEKLLETLVNLVERVAQEHGKTPPAVVLMENFHRLESIVRSQRMQRLDRMRRDLSDRHKQNRTEYVRNYMGRPLEKLSEFFDGVEQNLSRGVTPDEVGYLQQYSRAELKKIIRDYPAKDVKRNLEQLRKRVEKHLSEEGSLLTAVWHEMQQTLLAQYNQFNRLIAQCYPNANLALEFSDHDLLRFFNDIGSRSSP
ncbi:hypothetical protein BOX15_Mlig008992g2 [Macrostomum lignano]|uniref:Exocyst complex component Sec3 PIP2-binding N-terminal domain-containing protein n=1 Tax=Macrostomum lignano TaxID=282301 RepID=A0A267FYK9_9PLAT|nr:hypothetical protein BOX15_Mlig008992g2 [Macrostomum lignano]